MEILYEKKKTFPMITAKNMIFTVRNIRFIILIKVVFFRYF